MSPYNHFVGQSHLLCNVTPCQLLDAPQTGATSRAQHSDTQRVHYARHSAILHPADLQEGMVEHNNLYNQYVTYMRQTSRNTFKPDRNTFQSTSAAVVCVHRACSLPRLQERCPCMIQKGTWHRDLSFLRYRYNRH